MVLSSTPESADLNHQEVFSLSPQHETNNVLNQSQLQRSFQSINMFTQPGGDAQHINFAGRNLNQIEERENTPRNVADVVAIKDSLLNREAIDSLPVLPGNLDISTSDAKATVDVNGKKVSVSAKSEQDYLVSIRRKLMATQALNASSAMNDNARKANPYFPTFNGDGIAVESDERWRTNLELDLTWLSDENRTGPNVPPERAQVFEAYRGLLANLTQLHTPKAEKAYIAKHQSVVAARAQLEHLCRNPNAVKNASKFAVLLAAGALFTLFGVMDIKNKNISIKTLAMLGAVAYLMKGGSSFNFMKSNQFARLSRDGSLNRENTQKLQSLALGNAAAYNHMVNTVKDSAYYGEPITPETAQELMHPKKKRNGQEIPDSRKAVPEDIANMFVGMSGTDVLYILQGIRKTARTKDKNIVGEFAESLHSSETVRNDLDQLQSTPTASSSTL